MKKTAAIIFVLSLYIFASCGCTSVSHKYDKRLMTTLYDYFDTVITIEAMGVSTDVFDEACDEAEAAFKRYHMLFDIYNEYEDINNIATVNRLAGETVTVDPEIINLIELGKYAHELTDGAVNIAMGAVLRIWRDCRIFAQSYPEKAMLPDEGLLLAAAEHCDIENIYVDKRNNTVALKDCDMSLDVGAVGKGYALRKVAEITSKYAGSFMINCGGTVWVKEAKPNGESWVAGITDPLNAEGEFAALVPMTGGALATSGAYIRSFEVNGKEYGHIIDPDTLYPAEGMVSVSVMCNDPAVADILSTACYVFSIEKGESIAEKFEDAGIMWITSDGKTIFSNRFYHI